MLLVEGFLGSLGHVQGTIGPLGGVFPPLPRSRAVRGAAGDGRVLRLDRSPSGLAEVVQLARPNLLVPYGISELTPYPTFTPRQFTELFTRLDPSAFYRNHVSHLSTPDKLAHPLLDLLRVSALLSLAPLKHPRLVPVLERPGFCVYRRLGALPPARIVPCALPSSSDEEVLSALLADDADYAAATRIAPEDAPICRPVLRQRTGSGHDRRARAPGEPRASGARIRRRLARPARAVGAQLGGGIGDQALRVRAPDHAYRAVPIPPGTSRSSSLCRRPSKWGAALTLAALLGV